MGVGPGIYMYDVVVKKFTFAVSSPDEFLVTFWVSRRRRKIFCGHARLCVCLSVCVSVRGRMPTLLHGPDVT